VYEIGKTQKFKILNKNDTKIPKDIEKKKRDLFFF
jgi:hypothetical protein